MSGQITPAALIPALPALLMGIVLFLTARKLRVERERGLLEEPLLGGCQ